ncbi:MAG: metallophosphoesterase, partial [Desulfosalsimonadaceae bacterium]|nr:metallophosphoesterase [Desulfosalsimonadaceae bacterium]
MFGTILISICTFMHVYVFWRIASVPFIDRHVPPRILMGTGVILWAVFFFGRVIAHNRTGIMAGVLEFMGMNWMAILFLIFTPLLLTDIVTCFGFLMPRLSPSLRGWALLAGLALSVIALFQGLRPPVIEEYEVSLPGLPDALDGTVLVAVSDMHLGSQIGGPWLAARIKQIKAQQPDIVVLLGDIFEGHGPPEEHLIATFQQLTASFGIWAVPGNHEFHGKGSLNLFAEAGFKLLNNEWVEVGPGFVLAGVEDLTTRSRNGQSSDSVLQILKARPPGATILLSHTPWQAEKAAGEGVGLMLSGHTHGGQIWP